MVRGKLAKIRGYYIPLTMLGLNEDARDYQVKLCQQTEDSQVVKCPKCHKVKLPDNLCSLGKAWLTPLEGEN